MEHPWWSASFVDLNEKPLVEILFTKLKGCKSITFLHEFSSPCGYYHGRYCKSPHKYLISAYLLTH